MDVVYVLGTGSKWDNNELRYSLRSIAKYGIGLERVIIVGDKLPDFINAAAVHYLHFCDRPERSPYQNVFCKIEHVFRSTDLQQFLLSSDDHFFIEPVDFNHYPVHYKRDIIPETMSPTVGDIRYRRVMGNTRDCIEQMGMLPRFYEGHTNKLYTRQAWDWLHDPERRSILYNAVVENDGISFNSVMAAAIMRLHPMYPCRKREDIKLFHLNTPEDEEILRHGFSFSIYDSAIHTGVAEFLARTFPDRSPWEL